MEWAESDHERTPCRQQQPSSPLRQAELVTRAKEPTSPRPSLIHTEIKGNNFLYILLARFTSTHNAHTYPAGQQRQRERENPCWIIFCGKYIISCAHWTAAAFSTHCSFSLALRSVGKFGCKNSFMIWKTTPRPAKGCISSGNSSV